MSRSWSACSAMNLRGEADSCTGRTRRDRCPSLAQVGKGFAGRAAKSSGKKEALALAEEGGESLAAVFIKVCSLLLRFFASMLQLC